MTQPPNETENSLLCPVGTVLELVCGKWKALILWNLLDKTLRYGEISRLVPQATAKSLTQQLRELERDGLIERKVYPVVPPKVEYSLTDTGRSLKPVLFAMYDWGSSYLHQRGMCPNCNMKRN